MSGKRIEWVLGKEAGDGRQFWFAADASRNVWSFLVDKTGNATFLARSAIPTHLFLASFEALIPNDASEFSSPVCVGRNRIMYVAGEGELVLRQGRGGELVRRRLGLLPDSRIVVNRRRTLAAFYAGATRRYPHGVLGDRLEGSVLKVVRTSDLTDVSTVHIPEEAVFEGLGPMWADVDGDGREDLVSTVSNTEVGAAIYVAHANGTVISQTKPIGKGKTVEMHVSSGRKLVETASLGGYTTHRLGSRNLDMAVAADGNGDGVPELIIPDARMTRVVALQREGDGGGLSEKWSFWLGDELSSNIALLPLRRGGFALALGLRRGRVKLFLPQPPK